MKRGKSTPASLGRVSKSSPSEETPETSAPKSHWQLAFEHLNQNVVITNQNREAIDANPAFCRLVGKQRSEVIGRQFEDVLRLSENRREK